jgi:membrane protein
MNQMELVKKRLPTRVKNLGDKIHKDNLFLLSSSVSYYSALAIAPFLLIILAVAALIGDDIQTKVIGWASDFSPAVGKMIEIIFENVKEGIDIGSLPGILGLIILLWTTSLVFIQMRYSMDVIYGFFDNKINRSIWTTLWEKVFAMFVVFMAGLFLIVTSSLPGIVQFFFSGDKNLILFKSMAFILNFFIYIWMFWCIHFFTPSKRPGKKEALKMSILSSLFFIIGNVLLGFYFRGVAGASIYGAAGSLLVFLIWTYYSSFTLFLSIEVFLYLKKMGKIGRKKLE